MIDNQNKSQSKLDKDKIDQELWDYATQDVTPIKQSKSITVPKAQTKKQAPKQKSKPSYPIRNETPQSTPHPHQTDRKTAQKLKRGQIPIDATLDLHGMSKSKAYAALQRFITTSVHEGCKCVLIITGKGRPRTNTPLSAAKPGILKTQTPQWLSEPHLQSYILQTQIAKPKHGGEGAIYVLLRKKRH